MRENFYLYPLKGHLHIILGVQWLFELGDIHTNYQNITMRFEMGGAEYTLQGLKDEEAQTSNNRLELDGWANRERSCMGRPRRTTLRRLEDQDIIECQEEPRRATFHPWDDGGPMLDPYPPGDPTMEGQGEGGCTLVLGEVGAPKGPMNKHGDTTLGMGPSGSLTFGLKEKEVPRGVWEWLGIERS